MYHRRAVAIGPPMANLLAPLRGGEASISPPTLARLSARSPKQFVCGLKNDPAEANRVVLVIIKERSHHISSRACVVAAQCGVHPSGREEDISGTLDLNQQVQ